MVSAPAHPPVNPIKPNHTHTHTHTLFKTGHGLSYSNYIFSPKGITPDPATTVFSADSVFTVTGTVATGAGEPGGKVSILLYFAPRSATKWTRFGAQLFAFTKVACAAGGVETPWSITARVRDLEAFEPDTGDFEVTSGWFEVSVGARVDKLQGVAPIFVSGSYNFTWNFTK